MTWCPHCGQDMSTLQFVPPQPTPPCVACRYYRLLPKHYWHVPGGDQDAHSCAKRTDPVQGRPQDCGWLRREGHEDCGFYEPRENRDENDGGK